MPRLLAYTQGSPPLMRGTESNSLIRWPCIRITPAHAGNSPRPSKKGPVAKDHPRSCGEQSRKCQQVQARPGSPPLMRGTGTQVQSKPLRNRITPAHAGNRKPGLFFANGYWDHPRSCGEQLHLMALSWLAPGSPPLMRGTVTTYRGNSFG